MKIPHHSVADNLENTKMPIIAGNRWWMMTVTSSEGGTYVPYVISPTSFLTMYVGSLQVSGGFQPGLVLTQ
jgi:hypothetical protein